MTPEIRRGLIFFLVAPGLHCRGPDFGYFFGSGPRRDFVNRSIEPFISDVVIVPLLLCRFLSHAVRAVHAALVAVPGDRRYVDDHEIAGLDDAVGKVPPVGPTVGT